MRPERAVSSSGRTPSARKRKARSTGGGPRNSAEPGLPGVQKIKSALRQTRRLLAKETLAADVRVETERRMKAFEADLEVAERKRKEKTLAVRYHKVKFFERKKVTRKIKQVKQELAAAEEDISPLSKNSRTKLENTLYELRVDLNYILNYPKLEKYISLFPPKTENKDKDEVFPDQLKSDERRAAIRESITSRMDLGELSGEPELDHEVDARAGNKKIVSIHEAPRSSPMVQKAQGSWRTSKFVGSQNKIESGARTSSKMKGIQGDDFFDADSQSEPETDNASESKMT